MSSIVTASNEGPKPGSQGSVLSFEELLSDVERIGSSLAALSETEQHELYHKILSMLPAVKQSKLLGKGTLDESGFVDDAADDDDNYPVFREPKYQRDLKERWMSSKTPEERKNLALEGYRTYCNLRDSIALPDAVIKNLTACGKQVTARSGWLNYLQMLDCLPKA